MNFFRTLSALTAISAVFLAPSASSATDEQHDTLHPAAAPTVQAPQNQPEMHEKMQATKTPEERDELMGEQMKIMQNCMKMMGGIGRGAMMAKPGDMAARQGMMEQRMDMMQAMMQMMLDRTQTAPATK